MRPLKQTQLDDLLATVQNEEEYVFLDTARCDAENRSSFLFLRPQSRLEFFSGDDPLAFVALLEEKLAEGKYLAGWLAYEFGYLLEPRISGIIPSQGQQGVLLASFGVFQKPLQYNHESGESSFPGLKTAPIASGFGVDNLTLSQEKGSYLEAVRRIKEYIAAGDTYQVNYTLKLLFDFHGSPEAFYGSLRRNQSVAYGAVLRLGGEYILSLSPELFFRVNGKAISVCPMKGTMRRGRYLQEDQELCELLSKDPKNRSENVMIVDLLRNDLARLGHLAGDGWVHTTSLFDVERYESVLQMTSSIHATTAGNVIQTAGIRNVLKALFPCGSVTGAPKIRTMEIIRELEESPRGVYTGAIGYFAPDGRAAFNVPIRTIRIAGGKGEMGIGSGIVHDSNPEQEWEECLLKAHFLTKPVAEFVLIETLLWEPGKGYWLLDYHLDRLEKTAVYFSFVFSSKDIVESLQSFKNTKEFQKSCFRMRLTLAKDGTVTTTVHPCDMPLLRCLPGNPQATHSALPCIDLSEKKVDSSSPWFFHKTSERRLFQEEFARAQKESFFDVVFLNDRGELTEGCISNCIVWLDGKYYTPPVSSGLLEGTMRRKLLAENSTALQEKILTFEDLQRATALFCCNSVRGVVQVRLTDLS